MGRRITALQPTIHRDVLSLVAENSVIPEVQYLGARTADSVHPPCSQMTYMPMGTKLNPLLIDRFGACTMEEQR